LIEALAQLTRALDEIATLPETPALRREQIKLQAALVYALMHVKGYAASETKAAVERARLLIEQAEALGEPPEDPMLLFVVLAGAWSANFIAFNGDLIRELAAQFLALAEKQGTTVPLMVGHFFTGVSLMFTGDIAQGRVHLDRAVALYDPASADHARRFGVDNRISALCYRTMALWMLGYPETALMDAEQALKDAREIGHAAVLMWALGHIPRIYMQCGNYAAASALVDELVALADEKGALFWKAHGLIDQGGLFLLAGKAADAVQTITTGITARRSTGATAGMPSILSILARAHGEIGQFDDAWRCIGEAITAVETTKERISEAQVHRTAGEIALLSVATILKPTSGSA
jgi:tetratricopeptide (TPR) repeat protein